MSAEIDNQVQAYKKADEHDDFYGNRDIEYEQWLDGLDSDRMFAKEERLMKRLGLSCSCGAHLCDGMHGEGM
jgi:hypothetical protein